MRRGQLMTQLALKSADVGLSRMNFKLPTAPYARKVERWLYENENKYPPNNGYLEVLSPIADTVVQPEPEVRQVFDDRTNLPTVEFCHQAEDECWGVEENCGQTVFQSSPTKSLMGRPIRSKVSNQYAPNEFLEDDDRDYYPLPYNNSPSSDHEAAQSEKNIDVIDARKLDELSEAVKNSIELTSGAQNWNDQIVTNDGNLIYSLANIEVLNQVTAGVKNQNEVTDPTVENLDEPSVSVTADIGNLNSENVNTADLTVENLDELPVAVTADIENLNSENVNTADEPKKKRNRKAKPAIWHRNVVKHARQSGGQYLSRGGKLISTRMPKICDCSKCRFGCNEVTEERRLVLCKEFYGLGDALKQKLFLSSCVENVDIVRPKNSASKHRQVSRLYYIPADDENPRKRVCKKFFISTFSIGERLLAYTMENVSSHCKMYLRPDKRVGKSPHNITPPEHVEFIMHFIDSFPRVPSHYCRKDTNREYLSSELNLSIMYRLYLEKCSENGYEKPVGRTTFSGLFLDHEPKLSFYTPKKDQCPVCNAYKRLVEDGTVKELDNTDMLDLSLEDEMKLDEEEDQCNNLELDGMLEYATKNVDHFVAEYKKHKKREKDAFNMRDADKERAQSDHSIRAISFDLQAILQCPYAAENQLYYTRKLNIYNFTIYDSYQQDGFAYIWDETDGKKGSNEIASCLINYLQGLPVHVTEVNSFSDTCGGQNRNRNIAAAMLWAVTNIDHLHCINLKYMESGHSYLDADSMHARIEEARKHKRIYTPNEYSVVIQTARRNPKPYTVNRMCFSDIKDWKSFSFHVMKNVKKVSPTGDEGVTDTVQWLRIKWLRFEKQKPTIVQFKYDLNKNHFFEFDITARSRSRIRNIFPPVMSAYTNRLPIETAKKNDLLSLIKKQIIPATLEYSTFYNNLPVKFEKKTKSSTSEVVESKVGKKKPIQELMSVAVVLKEEKKKPVKKRSSASSVTEMKKQPEKKKIKK